MSKIYLPTEYLNKPCYTVNNGYIRVYESINNNYSNTVYDIYVNQDYMIREGTASYSTNTICVNSNNFTDNVFYRTDFDKILVIFFILLIICFYFPYRIISRLFGRWLKF